MTTTNHPLSETAAAELWEAHIPGGKVHYIGWGTFPEPTLRHFTAIIRAAFDVGREHEREHADPHYDPRPWQDCTRKDICAGDLVERRVGDILRIGVAHHQDRDGDWCTEDGWLLTNGDYWPLRRIPAPTPPAEEVELPVEFGAVITDVSVVGSIDYDYVFPRLVRVVDSWFDDNEVAWTPDHITAFTLPDGTRARRDGKRADGTPRFVKEAHNDRP